MAALGRGLGIALGWLAAAGLPGTAHGQEAPPLERPRDSVTATLAGSARVAGLGRAGSLEDLRAAINGATPPSGGSQLILPYDASLRLDLAWTPAFRSILELAHEPFEAGLNEPLGDDGHPPVVRQLYLEWTGSGVTLRAGSFEYSWSLRPHDEPFFLDTRAESAYAGAVLPTADRDVSRPAGLACLWRANDFLQLEAVALVERERGAAGDDESLAALFANFPLSERSAGFLALAHFAGEAAGDGVISAGLGWNGYFGAGREWELFVEGWWQGGSIGGGVDQRARAGQAGGRWYGGRSWIEASIAHRSGDDDPLDGENGNFLSYENQSRFLLVEDPEAGLDWDSNVTALRVAAGWRPATGLEFRLDAGVFRLAEDLVDGSGVARSSGRRLGTELDASLSWRLSGSAETFVRLGVLGGSDLLDDLAGEDSAWAGTAGMRLSW